jgi:carboxylesterase
VVESFEPARADLAVLVLHGFTASPRTVAPLTEHLARAGIPHAVPPLRGHGTRYADLRGVRWEDWLGDARGAYDALAARHARVAVVGHSVGGSIASLLAAERPSIAALVLVAPAIAYGMPALKFLPVLKRVARDWRTGPPSIADKTLAASFIGTNYDRFPIAAFEETIEVQALVPAALAKVTCPALVIQSRFDKVVKPQSAEIAHAHLGSRDKRLVWLERSNHELFFDLDSDLLCEAIIGFLLEAA